MRFFESDWRDLTAAGSVLFKLISTRRVEPSEPVNGSFRIKE